MNRGWVSSDLFVQAISDGCGCGFVDDAQHIEPSDGPSIFGGLALGVIEVSRNCDNSIVHSLGRWKYHDVTAEHNICAFIWFYILILCAGLLKVEKCLIPGVK